MNSQKSNHMSNSLKTNGKEIRVFIENNCLENGVLDSRDNQKYTGVNIGDGKDVCSNNFELSDRSQRKESSDIPNNIFKEDRDKFVRLELHKKIVRDLYHYDTQAKLEKLEQVKQYLTEEHFDHYRNTFSEKHFHENTTQNKGQMSDRPKDQFSYYQNKLNTLTGREEPKTIQNKILNLPQFSRPDNEKQFRKFADNQQKYCRTPNQIPCKEDQNNESKFDTISNTTYKKDDPDVHIKYKNFEYGRSKNRRIPDINKVKENQKYKLTNNNFKWDVEEDKSTLENCSKLSAIISNDTNLGSNKIHSAQTESRSKLSNKIETEKDVKHLAKLDKTEEYRTRKDSARSKPDIKVKTRNDYDKVLRSLVKHSHEFKKLHYETIKQSVAHLERLDYLSQKSLIPQ